MSTICYIAQGFPNPRGIRWQQLLREEEIAHTIVFGVSQFTELGVTGRDAVKVPRLRPAATAAFCDLSRPLATRTPLDDIRIVWARDILAGMSGYRLAKRLGAAFILDICDAYPEVMRLMADRRRWWLPLAARAADRFEHHLVRHADLVLTTCPESITHLVGKHRLSDAHRTRMLSVENVPLEPDLRPVRRMRSEAGLPIVFGYVGSYDRKVRDLVTVIRGAEHFRMAHGRDWRLRIATFDRQVVEADLSAAGLVADPRVEFVKPMPRSEIPSFYDTCDVGLVPHGTGPVLETTISNKLFEYVAAGLPVLASANAPNVRVLGTVGGGVCHAPASPHDFARHLGTLLANAWKPRDDAAWHEMFSWQAQSAPLRTALHTLLARRRS